MSLLKYIAIIIMMNKAKKKINKVKKKMTKLKKN